MKRIVFTVTIIIIFLLTGCSYPYTNELDSQSDNYIGYPTVESIDAITLVNPEENKELYYFENFICTPSINATQYELEISEDDSFATIKYSNIFDTNIMNIANNDILSNYFTQGTYYWRVRAIDNNGILGGWTDIFSFTGISVSSTNILPISGGKSYTSHPTLEWTDDNECNYYLQYSTNEAQIESSSRNNAESKEFTITEILQPNDYLYWRICPYKDGSVGFWSNINHFKVVLPVFISTGGWNNTGVIDSEGSVFICGDNSYNLLCDGNLWEKNVLEKIGSLPISKKIFVSNASCFLVDMNDDLWVWGRNSEGQLGVGTTDDIDMPQKVEDIVNVDKISCYEYYTLLLKADGTVWSCGYNFSGQLGLGDTIDRALFTQIISLTNIVDVSAGSGHSLALKDDGTLYSFGGNGTGALGDGTFINKTSPIEVGSNYSSISSGSAHVIATDTNGSVWTWGWNWAGQLGDGTKTDSASPIKVIDTVNIVSCSAGSGSSCVITNDNNIYTWGDNRYGTLGDGTTIDKIEPVLIESIHSIYQLSDRSGGHTGLITNDYKIIIWGRNSDGQLADGTFEDSLVPKEVYLIY